MEAPPPTTPTLRKDDFFDQKPAGRDYTSVIDTMSVATEQDSRHRDFDDEHRGVGSGGGGVVRSEPPSDRGPTLKPAPETPSGTPRGAPSTARSEETPRETVSYPPRETPREAPPSAGARYEEAPREEEPVRPKTSMGHRPSEVTYG